MQTGPLTSRGLEAVPTRDTFLDAVKAIAISRVIAWHTWTWWWLSWIGAMAAMFFASGALLDLSLARHGYLSTLRNRLRRLLVPFWWYSACAVAVMLAVGWRPTPSELAPWIVPLADPVGTADTPGLWIPLWYVRAYLWFVIGAGLLRLGVNVLGRSVLALPVLATLGLWLVGRAGTEVPLAVGDAATYSFFVLLGMLYARGATIRGRGAFVVGAAALASALGWWATFGPDSGIVNASYPLLLLAGLATVGFFLAVAPVLRTLEGLPSRLVDLIGSRALTIYLWQGFGLLAADQIVTRREVGGATAAVAAIVIVVTVTAAAAWAFGWVEDLAAGRAPRKPGLGLAPVGAAAGIALLAAAALQPATGTEAALPASGLAVVERNRVNEDLDGLGGIPPATVDPGAEPDERVEAAFEDWLDRWDDSLAEIESDFVGVSFVLPDGDTVELSWHRDGRRPPEEDLTAWMSLSKTVTGAWLAELAVDGVVALDDPLSTHLEGIPHGDDITLEHLVRHRAGLPTEYEDSTIWEANPRADLEDWFADPELEFEPGEGFSYSRRGYFLLAWALEEATGRPWTEVVRSYAAEAGVTVVFDDEIDPWPEVSHPGEGSYRGRTWAAGALHASHLDTARFHRWLLTEGISTEARDLMTRFATDEVDVDYGFALLPVCPCGQKDGWVSTPRYGLGAAAGTWVFDEDSTAIVFVTADRWLDHGPELFFYRLQNELLDAAG